LHTLYLLGHPFFEKSMGLRRRSSALNDAEILKWYAIYTKPRWEKKVHNLLSEKGIESYCPLNRVPRKWSDRIKVVEEPLFKSYVFVRVDESQRTDVRMVNGVVNFVYWNGKPALIRDREIEAIKRFLNEHTDVQVVRADLKPEDAVLITAGPLMNKEGVVVEVKNKVAKVLIESLGFLLVASIDKTKLVSLNKL
jgi:transcription antitermination factor NusG